MLKITLPKYLIFSNVLGLKRVAAKLIQKCLNFLQKQIRVEVAKEILEHVNNDDTFVKRIIICLAVRCDNKATVK